MDIHIQGNPGTGNTFQEVHIGTVQNYNPQATTVINHNYASAPKVASPRAEDSSQNSTAWRRDALLQYVMRLHGCVAPEWTARYRTLWERVVDAPEVQAVAYVLGKQQGTTFNRNLVASIIYIMCNEGIIRESNASRLAEFLEGSKEHSVRLRLGTYPDDSTLRERVMAIIRDF